MCLKTFRDRTMVKWSDIYDDIEIVFSIEKYFSFHKLKKDDKWATLISSPRVNDGGEIFYLVVFEVFFRGVWHIIMKSDKKGDKINCAKPYLKEPGKRAHQSTT